MATATLSKKQVEMARHALGLRDGNKTAYRNRYFLMAESDGFADWQDMVSKGHAKHVPPQSPDIIHFFCLTHVGAKSVLRHRETLDKEDFPKSVS